MKKRKQKVNLLTGFYWPQMWKCIDPDMMPVLAFALYKPISPRLRNTIRTQLLIQRPDHGNK